MGNAAGAGSVLRAGGGGAGEGLGEVGGGFTDGKPLSICGLEGGALLQAARIPTIHTTNALQHDRMGCRRD